MPKIRLDPKAPLTEEQFYKLVRPLSRSRFLAICRAKLSSFEREFGMPSKEAYQLYLAGKLPDTHESSVWMGTYQAYRETLEERES